MSRFIIIGISLFYLIFIYKGLPAFAGEDLFRRPWGEESLSEGDLNDEAIIERAGDESILGLAFIEWIKLYQDIVSPVDANRCPMYPSCSEYGIQVLRKHGPFLGLIMIADRLIHERDEMRDAPRIIVRDRWEYYDPMENNDFWFTEK